MMTTLDFRYDGVDEVLRELSQVYRRRRLVRLATGLAAVAAVVSATLAASAVAAGYWTDQPPSFLRWGLLFTVLAVWAAGGLLFLWHVALWRQNPAQNARFIEEAMPVARNDLINAVLLAGDPQQPSRELVQHTIRESLRRSRTLPLLKSISLRKLRRWSIAGAGSLLVLAALAIFQPGPMKRGLLAIFQPSRYVPSVNSISLLSLEPGDATVFAGQPVAIVARIRNALGKLPPAEVLLEGQGEGRPMLASDGNTTFSFPLGKVQQTARYAVRIGDSRWPPDKPFYTLEVLSRVEVKGLDVEYEYPGYTGMKSPQLVRNASGDLEAPVGTKATLTLRLSAAVPSVVLDVEGESPLRMRSLTDTTFAASLWVRKDGNYRLQVLDSQGRMIQQCPDVENSPQALDPQSAAGRSRLKGYYSIQAVPDKPPTVEFLAPNRDVTAPPGGKVAMRLKAADKYGLTDLRIVGGLEKAHQENPLKVFPIPEANKKEVTTDFEYAVPSDLPDDGSASILYWGAATDNRRLDTENGPQTATSRRFKIVVQNAAKVAEQKARLLEELRKRLLAILRLQEGLRVDTEIAWKKHTQLAQVAASGTALRAGQGKVRAELLDVADNFPFEPNMAAVQTALAILANNEAQLAIDQAQVLAALSALTDRDKPCSALAGTQDRIIETLQTLLSFLPGLSEKAQEKKEGKEGADLPPEAAEKLRKLKDDLDKFIDTQKKVIEGTDRLAKKPVDDFTPQDEQDLKDLQTTQDKWENFLNEAFSDFSKLAEQDFSNPALLKELLSVKADVTMAKDALKQKAAEIATPLEENGIGNAQELTANLEKWLPDTPDRQKWSMEDPAGGQENIEQPELPTQLEDLVGDLLEEEEDLFSEMEDQSSKYMMSGDKGIGWDAMDGPISSMNAQGVTGNQLPNPNELSGRSGEGRQGQSSGEFVQDEAVGKGGRRTPTRLTPEPFQKGEVNDKSNEPPGGATGGGKLSGAGGEGLEGPLPPPVSRQMPYLAGQQAALLNRAERLQAQFKNNDYANFKFLEAITLMNRMHNDLSNFRYRNALRSKNEVLGAMQQTQWLLAGNLDVTADTSSAMPKYIRDNIADAMRGKLPAEFRNVVEQYYRRLGEQTEK